MSGLLCCLRVRRPDMGAALSHTQEGEACDSGSPAAPPTMADVIRERKKKAGGTGLGTLRRRIANVARRPRDNRPDRECSHARFLRSVVSPWRLGEVFLLKEEMEALAALRDLVTQAELAREPARSLHLALPDMFLQRWWCDVELVGTGWSLPAHRAILSARSTYFRELFQRYPPSCPRVPLEGLSPSVSRAVAHAHIHALYGAPHAHCKYEGSDHSDCDLDLVDSTNNSGVAPCGCRSRSRHGTGTGTGTGAGLLAGTRDTLANSMRYLLESGELSDGRLVFPGEAGSRPSLELPCHRVVLAARSRFFRNVMSRRSSNSTSNGVVCVDEKVLPRRFARALLHAAYTDQVDLSLIGRNTSLPATTSSTNTTSWSVSRSGAATRLTVAGLDDAFQLYEIARFLEMPIVTQGCEDAIVESLAPDTLPHILRWAPAHQASQWVHRQAQRYLRDELVTILSAGSPVPAGPLAAALASPYLQASEPAALRALLRWAAGHKTAPVTRGGRRGGSGDAALRELVGPLLQHIRIEHIPPDNELLQQLVRRGILPPPCPPAEPHAAWLGRGSYRPARCFLPYLDELKALLEEQPVPEAELARARRARYMHRIPDTLYMVSSPCPPARVPAGAEAWCVPSRAGRVLRARVRELRAAPAAARAARHAAALRRQIALRAVREMSLPDICADLLLDDIDDVSGSGSENESPSACRREGAAWRDDCCRTPSGSSSLRGSSMEPRGSNIDNSRSGTCSRRDQPTRSGNLSLGGLGSTPSVTGRLSSLVPDVAMAPNANTHLLTHADYYRHPPPREYGGVVLQLDLGDGATHTPRPGSRAQRNSGTQSTRQREHAQVTQAMSCLRARADEDELRAAIDLSLIRAYSSFGPRGSGRRGCTLPPVHRTTTDHQHGASPRRPRGSRPEPPLIPMSRVSPSPVRRDYALHPHDYREGGSYGGSASTSRGHSPNNYA